MIVVRQAVPDDAERIVDIRRTGWREAYGHLLSAEYLAAMPVDPERWRGYIESGSPIMVAELDGDVVGVVLAGDARDPDPPRDLQLWMIYQYSRAHGSGTGQAMLDAAIGEAPAYLWVAEDNPRARAFYSRNGFVPDGARDVHADAENLAEIRMVR
jgi:GNAT superfamily N-acetyltransferase